VLLDDDELTLTTKKEQRLRKLYIMKEGVGKAGIHVIFPAWERISAQILSQ